MADHLPPSLPEYSVKLTKINDCPVGIRLCATGSGLRITKVYDEGLIIDWNKKNPGQIVHQGDHVVEVNGVRNDATTMLQSCIVSPNIEMVVRRTAETEHRFQTLPYHNLSREDFDFLSWLDDAGTKTGMPRRFVAELPTSLASTCSLVGECAICLCDFAGEAPVTQLPCKHHLCTKCAMTWLTQCRATCPLCLTPVRFPPPENMQSFDDCVGCDVVPGCECVACVRSHVMTPKLMDQESCEAARTNKNKKA